MYMKIAIIDDSKTQRENIKEILHNNGKQDVIETYASIKEYEQVQFSILICFYWILNYQVKMELLM